MLILLNDSFSRLKGEALAKCVLRVYPVHELAKGQERERYTDQYSTCFLFIVELLLTFMIFFQLKNFSVNMCLQFLVSTFRL